MNDTSGTALIRSSTIPLDQLKPFKATAGFTPKTERSLRLAPYASASVAPNQW